MNGLASEIAENLPKLLTSLAATGIIGLFGYLYKAGSWTKDHQRARLFEEQGDKFFDNELWESAIGEYKSAIEIWEKEVNHSRMLTLYQKLGRSYSHAGEVEKALESFIHCEALWDAIKKRAKMQDIYYELSQVYLQKRDLDRAAQYIGKAMEILRAQGSPRLPVALAVAARIAKERGRFEEAENDYTQAVQLLENIEDTLGLASVYYELGELKTGQKMTDLANLYYRKSSGAYEKLGSIRADEIKSKIVTMGNSAAAGT